MTCLNGLLMYAANGSTPTTTSRRPRKSLRSSHQGRPEPAASVRGQVRDQQGRQRAAQAVAAYHRRQRGIKTGAEAAGGRVRHVGGEGGRCPRGLRLARGHRAVGAVDIGEAAATLPPSVTWGNGTRSQCRSSHHSAAPTVPRSATTAVLGSPPAAT